MVIENMDNKDVKVTKSDRLSASKEDIESSANDDADFDKLLSVIPTLDKETPTKLDIVLEAITYINSLQSKLLIEL